LNTVEETQRRRINEFDPFQPEGPGRLGELEESQRSLKEKTRAEGGRRQWGDAPREER
jgi:hypothetical protein